VKILIPDLNFIHFRNIAGCLQTMENKTDVKTFLWNVDQRSIIDVFDEISPDVVLLHENQIDRAFDIVSSEFDFKYVLVASRDHPEVTKKPDAIITSKQFEKNFSDRNDIISLLPAAKVTQIHSGKKNDLMECDVLVSTDTLPQTPPIIESMMSLADKFTTKVIGETPVSLPSYLGKVNMFERADFIKSAKVFVDFGSYDYLDAAYLKTAPLFGQPPMGGLGNVKTFSDIPALLEQVQHLVDNPKESQEYANSLYEDVIDNHTYYHRTASVLKKIGLKDIADSLMDFMKELTK